MTLIVITVLPIFALIGTGWVARHWGFLGPEAARQLNCFVVYLALPALLFRIIAQAPIGKLWQPGFIAAFTVGSGCAFLFGTILSARHSRSLGTAAIDGLNAGYANTGFLGFPLLASALGAWSQPLTLIASMITICGLFAIAIAAIEVSRSDAPRVSAVAWRVSLAMLRNPVILAPIAAGLLLAPGWKPFAPVAAYIDLLAAAASPCALVTLGLFMADRPRAQLQQGSGLVLALTGVKLLFQPLAVYCACRAFRLPHEYVQAATVLAALPTGTGPFMLAELYDSNATRTANVILLATIGSIVTLPIALIMTS